MCLTYIYYLCILEARSWWLVRYIVIFFSGVPWGKLFHITPSFMLTYPIGLNKEEVESHTANCLVTFKLFEESEQNQLYNCLNLSDAAFVYFIIHRTHLANVCQFWVSVNICFLNSKHLDPWFWLIVLTYLYMYVSPMLMIMY